MEEDTPQRPELSVLRYVNPRDFAPRHAKLLTRLCDNTWDDALTPGGYARRIAIGDLWLFEAREPDAIVLLSTSEYRDAAAGQLNVEGLAGDGVIARMDDIATDLRTIASHYGAHRILAVTARDAPPLVKVGFEPKATIWHMELEDGRQHPQGNDDNPEG